nr:MAG TPA: hypothetical protein [Caudoviricetes sp.]
MCVFSRHYILTAHVLATTCETACNQRTFVHFNIFKIFHLIENFSILKVENFRCAVYRKSCN